MNAFLVTYLQEIEKQSNDQQVIKHALDDWYLSDKKEYDGFAAKYPRHSYRENGNLKK